ncbi:MAG: metal ABC transporter permease [Alphaproteobacteria bacterium]|nr:metal ABC transporter permease [Alphaproteobacteria bacterium]
MDLFSLAIQPFTDYVFMKRALIACLGIALSSPPVGVLLIHRRMSLMGEALSHGILPGIAFAYLLFGMWLPGLAVGGIIAGLIVTFLSNMVARKTVLPEDASFSSFYITALALGVLVLSIAGGNMNLMHLLFGNVLAVDKSSLVFIVTTSLLTITALILLYHPLIYDCFDPLFMRSVGLRSGAYNALFLVLIVCNLVAGCQALGTLMALGIMMVPASTAKLLSKRFVPMFILSIMIAMTASYGGLLLSYHLNWPSGPTIVLVCGFFYGLALVYSLKKVDAHHASKA